MKENFGLTSNINFSNIGKYPYPSTLPTSKGTIEIEKMYCVGNKWVPLFGCFIILIEAVKTLNFSLICDSNPEN